MRGLGRQEKVSLRKVVISRRSWQAAIFKAKGQPHLEGFTVPKKRKNSSWEDKPITNRGSWCDGPTWHHVILIYSWDTSYTTSIYLLLLAWPRHTHPLLPLSSCINRCFAIKVSDKQKSLCLFRVHMAIQHSSNITRRLFVKTELKVVLWLVSS